MESKETETGRLALIACKVFQEDIDMLLENHPRVQEVVYLEAGLHSAPSLLREKLQAEIDRISSEGKVDAIALGYGICGKGAVGIKAASLPILVPRVHDCISLYLGSDSRYRKEFEQEPGTFYITWGWFSEGMTPFSARKRKSVDYDDQLRSESFEYWAGRYGTKNAEAIVDFYNSWQKNYRRCVFIDTGVGDSKKCEAYAKDLAAEFGWEYKKIEGSRRFIEKLLSAAKGSDEILYLPPYASTAFDPKGRGLVAASSSRGGSSSSPGSTSILPPQKRGEEKRYGLGIDAGGTYTDAVVYDFALDTVLASGKGRTTVHDYTIGIAEAVEAIDHELLRKVSLVSVSTTLATNAIVEQRGRKVGLLLMHSGKFQPEKIENNPFALVAGSMDIDGRELVPLDSREIAQKAREMVDRSGVQAFAISGYGGSVNPSHEIAAKKAVQDATGLHVCCGHELSDLYNFYLRANTAVLNARIIPLLEQFLEDIDRYLAGTGIKAPVMVVRGDGSLMSSSLAREYPVETSLSGPAASVAGARYLTKSMNATVLDVGGTTSDIGRISDGSVQLCERGAQVGAWRTHVKALDMSTLGLGGDSEILYAKRRFSIGPRRILPLCRLASEYDLTAELQEMKSRLDDFSITTEPLRWYFLAGDSASWPATETSALLDRQKLVVELLKKGPKTIFQIFRETGSDHWRMVDMESLEAAGLVNHAGLTPTDLLHVSGDMKLWNASASKMLLDLYSMACGLSPEKVIGKLFDQIGDTLLQELILKQLPESSSIDRETPPELLRHLVRGGVPSMKLRAAFTWPLIGIGAPVTFFTRNLQDKADIEITVPAYAEVANAVGAITSPVTVVSTVTIIPTVEGNYGVRGIENPREFESFEEAALFAEKAIREEVVLKAEAAGTGSRDIVVEHDDLVTEAADGSELFLERFMKATITGVPV
jgi:N-methylhydantoinase A/oxoprolinase/acetone carboxylase beta subunit